MQRNEGGFDRTVRIIAGIVLIALVILKVLQLGVMIAIFGAIILLAGLMGFCILYVLLVRIGRREVNYIYEWRKLVNSILAMSTQKPIVKE